MVASDTLHQSAALPRTVQRLEGSQVARHSGTILQDPVTGYLLNPRPFARSHRGALNIVELLIGRPATVYSSLQLHPLC